MGGCFPLLFLLGLILPVILFVLFFNIAAFSFTELGLSPTGAVLLFWAILLGSVINIPVSKKRIYLKEPHSFPFSFIFYHPPKVKEQVIAVNLGGAIIPTLFSLYLLMKVPILPAVLATTVVAIISKSLSKIVPGVGITMPAFIPPIIAALAALIFAGGHAAPVAFIAGVLGTLIGADLMNLHRMDEIGSQVMSIGGAGVFDGIFLVGILAAFLTAI